VTFDPQRAAGMLHQIRTARRMVPKLPPDIAPGTEDEGAQVQHILAHHAGAMPPAGFKIGATSKRMQEYLGVSGPAAGFMAAAGIVSSGAALPYAGFTHPGVECELAVRLAHDLPPGPCTQEQAAAAVGQLFAGIELVENRYEDGAAIGVPTLVADQFYHAASVIGAPGQADWRSLDFATLRGTMTIDGQERGAGVGTDLLGHPMNCLAWLASSAVAAAFGGLKAGQVVMLGSVIPVIWLTGPASVTVAFPPLPAVTLRLT
jgi:2-keto-4-pentenoate hydratase